MYAVTDRLQDPCKWLGSFGPKCTISDKSKMAACINRLGDLKKAVIEYKTLENQASATVTLPWVGEWEKLVESVNIDGYVSTGDFRQFIILALRGINTLRAVGSVCLGLGPRSTRLDESSIRLSSKFGGYHTANIETFIRGATEYLRGEGYNEQVDRLIDSFLTNKLRNTFNAENSKLSTITLHERLHRLTNRLTNLGHKGGKRSKKQHATRKTRRHTRRPAKK